MSTEYNNYRKEMTITCDICGSEDHAAGDFKECINQFKKDGWKLATNAYGEWCHFCSIECKLEGI